MPLRSCLLFACVCIFLGYGVISGQENLARDTSSATIPTITAAATPERVRFVAASNVVRLQVQLFSEFGSTIFDVSSKGNVFDWTLHDGNGQILGDGDYLCVVTAKSLSGRINQRVGTVVVQGGIVTLQSQTPRLTAAQQHAVGPVEENAELTVLQGKSAPATTVVAHDGRDGQLTSTTGALTFRTGDIFSGKEKEQMRLTEDGRLGIGTSEPRAKLDVAGTIRAQRFVIARPKVAGADNTGILSADTPATDSVEEQPLIAGTGTQNRIAKWVDNAGTLGDSVVAESADNIGIGTTSPTHKLDVQSTGANGAIRSVNETFGVRGLISEQHSSNVVGAIFVGLKSRGTLAAPTAVVPNDFGAFFSNKWYDGTSYVQSGAFGFTVDGPVSNGVVPTRLSFVTSSTSGDGPTAHGVERMTILSGGNVGIGTTTPIAKLDVAGAVNASQYNIGGNKVFSISANNTFAGIGAGQNNVVDNESLTGLQNSFFGVSAGASNMSGISNSFFGMEAGRSNTSGSWNSFFGIVAGESNTMGSDNSFFGSQAGSSNTTEDGNTFLGALTNGTAGITNATVIGHRATVTQSNSLVLGAILGVNGCGPGFGCDTVKVGIGTTTPQARLHVVGAVNFTGLRTLENATSPNVIGGFSANTVGAGVHGATISGGGFAGFVNQVGGEFATIGGGSNKNAATGFSTISGGRDNAANGTDSAIGGGRSNSTAGQYSTVPGGNGNAAAGDYSFAAGRSAKANHQGAFVWGDSNAANFASTANNQFLIRAGGGVGINTNAPATPLHVQGGHVYLGTPGTGVILKSPNGAVCRRLWVDDAGTMQFTGGFACP